MRLIVASSLLLGVGTTLLLSTMRRFARAPMVERLRPYVPGGMGIPGRSGVLSVESFHDLVGPLAGAVGERLSRLFGISEELALRLERIHSPLDVTSFRVRQLGWSLAAFGTGALVATAGRPPPLVGLLLVVGAPLLAFLVLEQQVAGASSAWKRRVFLEMPVVSEQLAMLLSAGYSLGGALNRLARRGDGACARDLARVCGRVRQGLSDADALAEWAAIARVDAVERVVAVLSLNRESADLGRLISEEARAIRRDAHRQLLATVERRGQQVWIPVTVATLLPGVIFMAIPFIEALRLYAGS